MMCYFLSDADFWSSFLSLSPSLFLSLSVEDLSSDPSVLASLLASDVSAPSSVVSTGFSGSLTTVGAATVAMTKSLSVIVGATLSGSLI